MRTLAERKVAGLSYASFADLSGFFFDKFHVTLFDEKDVKTIIEAIEVRNISVHNRCIINQRFVKRTGSAAEQLNKSYAVGIDFLTPQYHYWRRRSYHWISKSGNHLNSGESASSGIWKDEGSGKPSKSETVAAELPSCRLKTRHCGALATILGTHAFWWWGKDPHNSQVEILSDNL